MSRFTNCTSPTAFLKAGNICSERISDFFQKRFALHMFTLKRSFDMSIVPEFLIKRVYKKGSLTQTDDGVRFDLKNVLGPGFISGFSFVKINDETFESDKVKLLTQGEEIPATEVSEEKPVGFRLGQEGTVILEGARCLKEGINQIIIELMNPEAGKVKLNLTDNFMPA
jgi:hypothetical protein